MLGQHIAIKDVPNLLPFYKVSHLKHKLFSNDEEENIEC